MEYFMICSNCGYTWDQEDPYRNGNFDKPLSCPKSAIEIKDHCELAEGLPASVSNEKGQELCYEDFPVVLLVKKDEKRSPEKILNDLRARGLLQRLGLPLEFLPRGQYRVWVNCKICNSVHPMPIVLDKSSWDNSTFQEMGFECPFRKEKAKYNKTDMFIKK